MNRIRFPSSLDPERVGNVAKAGRPVGELQTALARIGVEIKPSELARKEIGESTAEAVRDFQRRAGLDPEAGLDARTVETLNVEVAHRFVAGSKARTRQLHDLLKSAGHELDADEVRGRKFGRSTEKALKRFQEKAGLPADGRVSEVAFDRLRDEALAARLGSKAQVAQVHKVLLRALNIAKLEGIRVETNELRRRTVGSSTKAAVAAIQAKYGLPTTGAIDAATHDRLVSIAQSVPQPARRLKAKSAAELRPLRKAARLNTTGAHVAGIQSALAFLGHEVEEAEFRSGTFGKSTRAAVVAFQQARGLPVTGHAAGETMRRLNAEVVRANPDAAAGFPYRLRGSVRDELWRGMAGATVQVFHKPVQGEGAKLAERQAAGNGFFDIPYDPPRDPATGQVRLPYHLEIKALDAAGAEIGARLIFNPTQIAWANFTKGDHPYRGTSMFEAASVAIVKATGAADIGKLVETTEQRQISQAAAAAAMPPEDVMRLVLSRLAADRLSHPPIGAAACYAFIGQNLPSTLPGDLLRSTEDWEIIEQLVDVAANGIVFLDADLQALAFDNAVKLNLIPISVGLRKEAILAALAQLRQTYALEKPILVGNGSVRQLLDASLVDPAHHGAVAEAFLKHRNFGPELWADVAARPADFGGQAAIADFRTTVEIGHIAKNFPPMVAALKEMVADPAQADINSARDLAKLSQEEWVGLIGDSGVAVPPNTDGANAGEQIATYAATLRNQSELLFPAIALTAAVARSAAEPLPNVRQVQALLDDHPDFDLRRDNVDKFVRDERIELDEAVLAETRVLQRVHRIAPTAAAGQVLLEDGIHSSAQIVALGKDRFVAGLTAGDRLDARTALTIFGFAEHRHAQVLQRIADYRLELHRTDTNAIVNHTFNLSDLPEALADIPSLETLFGSLDFCACAHCQSVYGPAAYLADMLRFLDRHPSETAGKTVKAILFERRPDIGEIKLNCENSETPLPYVDLVCEVLENAAAAAGPGPAPGINFQTTRPAAELRAAPEHVNEAVYDTLRGATFPLNVAFDLWQEEARTFLRHLGTDRWELMAALQRRPAGGAAEPSDLSIAGEYWTMSTIETGLVAATDHAEEARQREFWGLGAGPIAAEMKVAEFLRRSHLSYDELLELLTLRWLNPPDAAAAVAIVRPDSSCDTEKQTLVNLTVERLDRIHRLLRLRRHLGWAMWEIDLLIRAPAIGNGTLDGQCLVRMYRFAQVQKRLGLSVERLLALYGDLNSEARFVPSNPARTIPSLYENLFLNPAVVRPTDPAFTLPLAGGAVLTGHEPAIVAAFSLGEADLALLRAELGNDDLTVASLSAIGRHALLAQALAMRVEDLLTLLSQDGVANAFAGPQSTLTFIRQVDRLSGSSWAVDELDFLLNARPDSPIAWRDEVVAQHLAAIREALRADPADSPAGVVVSQVSAILGVAAEQARLLVEELERGGDSLSEILRDPRLLARDEDGGFTHAIDKAAFADAFSALWLLQKAGLVVLRFGLKAADLGWLLANAGDFRLLDLGALPVAAAPAASLFPAWHRLVKWTGFAKHFPEPEGGSLRAIFDQARAAAPIATVEAGLAALTQWDADEVRELVTALALQHGGANSDFTDIDTYLRMEWARRIARRTGVSPAKLAEWAGRDGPAAAQKAAARETRQAAKSKYDDLVWLDKVTPLEDSLRERKRDALIGYLVARSLAGVDPEIAHGGRIYANPAYWRDANDLLKFYLIDVEMCACQLTSRIKQAISSTQMFVQRALLGLEQPLVEVSRAAQQDAVSDNSWKQWRWMKNYRVWEANRKVFLYPENWIEPELRDDKSPFFEELESDILQADITDENAEAAFRRYVQKVQDVSRLDIVGIYHEIDDLNPQDDLARDVNRLHVVGRTRAQPAIYHYRSFDLNYGEWSPWRKIDLDIQGEHVVPVVYNRRLYLFWLSFIDKPQKVKRLPPTQPTSSTSPAPEPPLQHEIQLCWSTRTGDGWTAKRVSHQTLIHPWQRPHHSYNLKPRYKSRDNMLWLDLYVSQSPEFNSTRFWDPYGASLQYMTARTPFDATARPWHSSSFLFDGEVVEARMKPLAGEYYFIDAAGIPRLTTSNSLDHVHRNFDARGQSTRSLSGPFEIAPRLPLPDGMRLHNTRMVNTKAPLNAGSANILENGQSRTLLTAARSPFEIVASQHNIVFDSVAYWPTPFIYQDSARAFFVKPEWQQVMVGYNQMLPAYRYKFFPFYHPYAALFLRELNRSGVEGLLNRPLQLAPQNYYPGNGYAFAAYGPSSLSVADHTVSADRVDFERYGAYSQYNWEIFFHAPLMIACRLSQNQRFEEAMRWFHYIFDPTDAGSPDVPQRYWITKPFHEQNSEAYRKQRIENLLNNVEEHEDELRAWKNNPFKPHLIARYRPIAYQKTVVMKYLDNLIAWGDQLFRRDTIEAINEATTLYVLAYELLGRRPVAVPNLDHADKSYNELIADEALDPFGNKKVDVLMENFTGAPGSVIGTPSGSEPLPTLDVFYFAIPGNDRLLDYWKVVEDRLFKIRHCMNIQGVVRQLPLFEPPIDPALLVKAAAAGIDLSSVIADLAVPAGPYRFQLLAQKAGEFCAQVQALGDKLLGALEKRDAEGLALLRSTHEVALLKAVKGLRKLQIEEANANWAALEQSKRLAEQKKQFYESREFINLWEGTSLILGGVSALAQTAIAVGYSLAGGLAMIPRFTVGMAGLGGSPAATADPADGARLATMAEGAVKTLAAIAGAADKLSSLASTMGSYRRREDDWKFQAQLATTEIAQIEKQIIAAQLRLAIAEKELENQDLQIEQAERVDAYMRDKYTSRQLYEWQVGQISSVYFQSYQLAFDMAKRAEKCFAFERGEPGASFVQFGYWDSLKKGLLAGERLANDLRRMEAAWLQRNARELEITKNVSLAQLAPLSLLALKESGNCTVVLPEWLFDLDYPGHHFRRLKTVSVSIPAVVGPYTSVNCTLTLVNHGIRVGADVTGGYGDALTGAGERFHKSAVPQVAIATSHGQNDNGMFELSFNDERYLPFEGAGAVSEWRLELPQENNQFGLEAVSDVIIQLRYTARASGDLALADAAKANLAAKLPVNGVRMIVLNQEMGSEWYRFLNPGAGEDQIMAFTLGRDHLPFLARGKAKIVLTGVDLIAEGPADVDYVVELTPPAGPASLEALEPEEAMGGRQHMAKAMFPANAALLGDWQIRIRRGDAADFKTLAADEFGNCYLVLGFKTQ